MTMKLRPLRSGVDETMSRGRCQKISPLTLEARSVDNEMFHVFPCLFSNNNNNQYISAKVCTTRLLFLSSS